MRAEDLKQWLVGIQQEEEMGTVGTGDSWRLLVQIIQSMWESGTIPTQLSWVPLVLIPKGKRGLLRNRSSRAGVEMFRKDH